MGKKEFGFETTSIHGHSGKDQHGSLITPIYSTSTYIFDSTAQGAARFALEEDGYIYDRLGNPTNKALEETLAKLEGGEAALATVSRMGAITATIWTTISAGQEIVADKTLYGCTFEFLEHHITRFGVKVHFIDMSNEDELRAALSPDTRIVYLETPANPTLKITDIRKTAAIAHEAFLVHRGLKTLGIRMERHCSSAQKVAEFLETSDKIEKVYYPGLPSHEGHELATLAVSLGATETLIEHPASMTHSPYSDEELEEAGIPAGLIRFSVGLEDPEDIIEDLRQALAQI